MARDYARRKPARRILHAGVAKSRGRKSSSGSRFQQVPYMIAGIFIGLLIAGFLYIKMQPMQVAHEKTSLPTKVAHAKTKHARVVRQKVTELSTKQSEAAPRYDFYTILTKDKPNVNEEDEAEKDTDDSEEENNVAVAPKEVTPPPKITVVTQTKKAPAQTPKYALQVAAMKKLEDADRLKARLLLQGHDVYISKQKIKNVTWYRVNIGPYSTASNAKAQQRKLKEHHINSMLLTV